MIAGGAPNKRGNKRKREHERKTTPNPVENAVCLVLSSPNNKLKELTKSYISRIIGISYKNLEISFKKDLGFTLFDFIDREKLHRAAFILEQDREITFLEMADLLGFDDYLNFESRFEKYFLIKPVRYQAIRNHTNLNYE